MPHRRQPSATARHHQEASSSSSPPFPADGISSDFEACLQRLPAATQRFLSLQGRPSELNVAKELSGNLGSVCEHLDGHSEGSPSASQVVASALEYQALRVALLRLVAIASRLTPTELFPDPNVSHTLAAASAWAFFQSCEATAKLLRKLTSFQAPAVDFARKLLRMQTLQALSRQLAAALEVLQSSPNPYHRVLQQQQQQQRWPHMLMQVGITAYMSCNLLAALALHVQASADPEAGGAGHQRQQQQRQAARSYLREFVAALHASYLMEHAAKLLLLLKESVPLLEARMSTQVDGMLPQTVGRACTILQQAYEACSRLHARLDSGAAGASRLPSSVLDHLCQVLSGRCLQHAMILHGLEALCIADRGPMYGLPYGPWYPSVCLARFAASHGSSVSEQVPVLGDNALQAMLAALQPVFRVPPLGRRAGLALLMRVGRLAVVSGQVWASATAASFRGSGLEAILPCTLVGMTGVFTLHVAFQHLRPLQHDSAAHVAREVLAWWSLVEGVVRHALCAPACMVERLAVYLEGTIGATARWGQGVPLPAAPPPGVAAALAGGFLPCLERLLRRTGVDFHNLETVLANALLGRSNSPQWLIALLAYGEERQAAALVVTVGKLLRRADPRVVATPLGLRTWALLEVVGTIATVLWPPAEPKADVEASAPQQRQLGLLTSCMLCEWLPPLSRLLQRRTVPAAAASAEQHRSTLPGAALSESACVKALRGVLPWVSALALQCLDPGSSRLVGTAAAASGSAAPAAAPATPADACVSHVDWRLLLLEEVDVVRLLGAVLGAGADWHQPGGATHDLALGCCAVAAAFPEQVRQAVVVAAAEDPDPAAAGWRPARLRALVPLLSADVQAKEEGGDAVTAGSSSSSDSRSGGGDEARMVSTSALVRAVDALAEQLDAWSCDGQAGADGRQADGATGLRAALHEALTEPGCFETLPEALVSPGELRLRGLLRGCGNPGCANLAGDSEAEVKLKGCGRCGAVGYCCRECQVAHWRAGHKEVCGQDRVAG
ncbi:hypothetical protein Agub_g6187 [Astrephomene gubernaculifera]|uniref:phytol kinase n=1 Tax=Astrephomene gubernaculifera TaxID=47775 RepID=A0AAD3DPG2_9CHLO|nr:hypothetical protein Agub_g6187 [Astrephomene gubernaculifera]